MKEEQNYSAKPQENEVDLGVFFTLISKVFNKIGVALGAFFRSLSSACLYLLLLLKRNILWLALSAGVGFAFGLYQYYSSGPSYYADMVVRTNFESSRQLYQKIDYFNALIREGQTRKLADIFRINEAAAAKMISFEAEPVDDPLEAAKLYKNSFLTYKRDNMAADTTWSKTIKYQEFVSDLTKYDYPLHTIRLFSRSANLYSNVQEGLLNLIRNNTSLKDVKEANMDMLKTEEGILVSSLNGIDSLRKAYNKKIATDAGVSDQASQGVVFAQGIPHAPEVELYDKELMLKDELMSVKNRMSLNRDIVQVYSDFNGVGNRVPKFKESFITNALIGLVIAFVLILLINFYRYLARIDKKQEFFV